MLRVLWGSPLPPIRSGISDYAIEVLGELGRLCEVRVLRPPQWGDSEWALGIPTVDTWTVPERDEIPLWHIGNNPYHEWLLQRASRESAVLVLHDLVLHHLLAEATLARGESEEFSELMRIAHSEAGERLASARGFGFTARRDPFLFPARGPFLTRAMGVIVHSRWGAEQVRSDDQELPIRVANLCVRDPGPVDRDSLRANLGIDPETYLILHLGFLTPDKGLESVLLALVAAVRMGVRTHLVLVGQDGGGADGMVQSLACSLGIEDHVTATGWVAEEEMIRLPSAADLGVVLRDPSAGETSAAVLRFLACGTPVAVVGHRQYLEWPRAAAVRITPGPSMAADLSRAIVSGASALATGGPDFARIAARQSYEAQHTPQTTARQLVTLVDELTSLRS